MASVRCYPSFFCSRDALYASNAADRTRVLFDLSTIHNDASKLVRTSSFPATTTIIFRRSPSEQHKTRTKASCKQNLILPKSKNKAPYKQKKAL
mmetsp:Transcript_26882/g.59704  ORF Transcript_26882/g.59704 Transcript_26882/m.59704 type:complete len:94 (-) Transcript_26882:34-315(-)